jgi:hypothetical protein
MRIRQSDTGRWATIRWDDVGDRDAIIVEVNGDDVRVFEPYAGLDSVSKVQVVEMREHLQADRRVTG